MVLSAGDWLAGLAAELGVDAPSDSEVEDLLAIAAIAAHSSERTAAPITCWLVARASLSPHDARAVAQAFAESLGTET